ncbi:MAG: Wzz/FepE/Etk N-terminal domain-containing protein [Bacteroidota bacterium]
MEDNSSLETLSEKPPFNYEELFTVLWGSRKLIGIITISVTVAAIIISLFLPKYYRSTVVILPETNPSKLAGLSNLASLAGVNVGGEVSLSRLYPTIVTSEAVLKNVIYQKYRTASFSDSVDLLKIWDLDDKDPQLAYELMLKSLRNELEVSLDSKTTVLTISLSTQDPQLSADIVNAIASELDLFVRTKRTTNATEERKWIEGRLIELKGDLEKSENALKDFRENNRRVADSPQLLLEQERFIREVQINSTLYEELKKQYELAKIEEIKNIPIVNIMDAGRPAAKKEKPRRSIIVFASFFLSFFGGMGFVYLKHKYGEKIVAVQSLLKHASHRTSNN